MQLARHASLQSSVRAGRGSVSDEKGGRCLEEGERRHLFPHVQKILEMHSNLQNSCWFWKHLIFLTKGFSLC